MACSHEDGPALACAITDAVGRSGIPQMTPTLVLVEKGIPSQVWMSPASGLLRNPDSLLLTETSSDAVHLKSSVGQVLSIHDVIAPGDASKSRAYEEAHRCVGRWLADERLVPIREALTIGGVSLWEAVEYHLFIQVAFPVLLAKAALERVLTDRAFTSARVLRGDGMLLEVLRLVTASGREMPVDEILCPVFRPRGLRGKLVAALAGWISHQPLGDQKLTAGSRVGDRRLRRRHGQRELDYLVVLGSQDTVIQNISPVLRSLRPGAEILAVGAHEGPVQISEAQIGVPVLAWSHLLPLRHWPGMIRDVRRVRQAWRLLSASPEAQEAFEAQGVRLWPCVRGSLERMFTALLPTMVFCGKGLDRLFRLSPPAVVMAVPDRWPLSRLVIEHARRCGVPSFGLQCAMISDAATYGPMFADHLATMDQRSAEIFTRRGGIEPGRISITGMPRWDNLSTTVSEARTRTALERLGLSPGRRFVLFATQPFPLLTTRRMVEPVAQVLARIGGIDLVLKVHPRESTDRYEPLVRDLSSGGVKIWIVAEADLHLLLTAAELLVTGFSNVVMEAALLDCPVLTINLTGEPEPLPYAEWGIALAVHSAEEAEAAMVRILSDPKAMDHLKAGREQLRMREPQLVDGKSTERVVDLIRSLASGTA
jgi:glycosyltransferase involved in cell wall biosynthesis